MVCDYAERDVIKIVIGQRIVTIRVITSILS
jgi:hypothetical protein